MRAILAVNNKGYIGLKYKLPWYSKDDLKHFKNLTLGGKLLVGRSTAQNLPTLPGREIVIWDRNDPTIDYSDIDWCIGGKGTYEAFCHLFTELHISHINDDTVGDVDEPNLSNLNPDCKTFHYYFN